MTQVSRYYNECQCSFPLISHTDHQWSFLLRLIVANVYEWTLLTIGPSLPTAKDLQHKAAFQSEWIRTNTVIGSISRSSPPAYAVFPKLALFEPGQCANEKTAHLKNSLKLIFLRALPRANMHCIVRLWIMNLSDRIDEILPPVPEARLMQYCVTVMHS
jgi:hypothetical protein